MLQGRSIQQIAVELQRQLSSKRDFVVPTSILSMNPDTRVISKVKNVPIEFTDRAHRQLASHLDIPIGYYNRMKETQPDLLAENVNRWWETNATSAKPDRRMLRTLDGKCRAYLSDRFLCIDNWDVLDILLPAIQAAGCEVISAEVTENKMYVKAITPRITGEIKKGDVVQAGLMLSNSEVGDGCVQISPLMYRLVCLNGLVVGDMSLRRHHVGKRITEEHLDGNSIYSRETIGADIRAFLLKARDTVKAVLDQTIFNKIVGDARQAAGVELSGSVDTIVAEVTDRFKLSENEGSGLMKSLIEGADLSQWGLVNAMTVTAHKSVNDYDRSVELERFGGEILSWSSDQVLRLAA